MGTYTLAALSILPVLAVAVFLVSLRWPASQAMPLSYVVAILLSGLVWGVPSPKIVAASINGLIVAGTLLYIIFGAILLLNTRAAHSARSGRASPTSRRTAEFRSSSSHGSLAASSKDPPVSAHRRRWPSLSSSDWGFPLWPPSSPGCSSSPLRYRSAQPERPSSLE